MNNSLCTNKYKYLGTILSRKISLRKKHRHFHLEHAQNFTYTLLLKQKKLPVLNIKGFLFRMSTHDQVKALSSTHAEKETRYIQYGPLLLFQ